MHPKIEIDLDAGILSVDGENFMSLSPNKIGRIIEHRATWNYSPMKGVTCIGPGPNGYTLRTQLEAPDGNVREILAVDAQSTYSVANFGHGNSEIITLYETFLNHGRQFVVPAGINNPYAAAFLSALTQLTGMDRVFPKVAGTEGPATAIHVACLYWEKNHPESERKPIILAMYGCFHGRDETARRLYRDKKLQRFSDEGDYSRIIKIPYNDLLALRNVLENYPEEVAALILEPIQGEGGIIPPRSFYLQNVVEMCHLHDVVCIFDEVQTGYGRAGWPFYFQKYRTDTVPDIICFGKAAGAGLVPLSGIAGKEAMMGCLVPGTPQGSTWSRSPSESFAGLIAIQYLLEHDLCRASRNKGEYLRGRLLRLMEKHPDDIADVRGEGLMLGIELAPRHSAEDFIHRLLFDTEVGVLTGSARGTKQAVRIMPPLTIDEKGLDDIANSIEEILKK